MNIFIIAAQTLDGYIGRNSNDPAIWTSKEDKKRFVELTKDAGVVIMGSNTFKTLPKPLKDRLNIIYTRNKNMLAGYLIEEDRKVEITDKEPSELIKDLKERGFKKVAICGGSQIYSMFLKAGLVNTMYLSIEPVLFGHGVGMFNTSVPKNIKLELTRSTFTENGAVFLDYKVTQEI
jgi:dihydrofolate reductase